MSGEFACQGNVALEISHCFIVADSKQMKYFSRKALLLTKRGVAQKLNFYLIYPL